VSGLPRPGILRPAFSLAIPRSQKCDRSMSRRRKGELSNRAIDERWPHQVAIPNNQHSAQHKAIIAFCSGKDQSPLGHTYVEDGQYQDVLWFGRAEDAQEFAALFNGRIIDPKTRPRWPSIARHRSRRQPNI